MNRTLTLNYRVEPFSEDHTGRLRWGILGNWLLRTASLHAAAHGFGYDDMIRTGHAWVLSRLVVEMERMPRTGEAFSLSTWVPSFYRQFTDRLFSLTTPDGTPLGHARSIWALIDTTTRRPLNLDTLADGGFSAALEPRDVPIAPAGRFRIDAAQPERTLTAGYCDLDINGHVNSVRYIEMALDALGSDRYDTQRPQRIEAAYAAEARMGDAFRLYRQDFSADESAVEIRRADDERSLFKALVRFALL